MLYTIHIPNKEQRIAFAVEVKQLIQHSTTYIPGKRNGLYQSDLGIKADITQKELAQIKALIARRGYDVSTRKSLHE
jgi:hypothetical protein